MTNLCKLNRQTLIETGHVFHVRARPRAPKFNVAERERVAERRYDCKLEQFKTRLSTLNLRGGGREQTIAARLATGARMCKWATCKVSSINSHALDMLKREVSFERRRASQNQPEREGSPVQICGAEKHPARAFRQHLTTRSYSVPGRMVTRALLHASECTLTLA